MYDYRLVPLAGKAEFKPWSDAVPTFSYNKALPYFQVTIDSMQLHLSVQGLHVNQNQKQLLVCGT